MLIKICISIGFIMVFGCTPKSVISANAIKETQATIRDMHGLDGCSFLLITDDNKKLLPANENMLDFKFIDGLRVQIQYKHQNGVNGICMAEDEIIELINIKELIGINIPKPPKKECVKILDPVKSVWSKAILMKENPYRMWRYKYQDGFAYYFMTKNKNILYDCQGNFMCEDKPNMRTCVDNIAELTEGTVVWTLDQ